jgi:replicative DNA helicase
MTEPHDSSDRLPPQSRDAERSVLGSMLRDNRLIGDVLQIIREDNFYLDAHRKIYKCIVTLYDRGHPADLVMMAELLKEQKQIEDVGGYKYLADLWDAAPTPANAEYYARIVRDKAIVRYLIHATTETLRDAYDNMPADELMAKVEKETSRIAEQASTGQAERLGEGRRLAFNQIDDWHNQDQTIGPRLGTGLIGLDEKTGGLQDGELLIIAARTSIGKTALALYFARHIAVDLGRPIFYASVEQKKKELCLRLLCCQAQVDGRRIRRIRGGRLGDEEIEKLAAARRILDEAKFFLDDASSQNLLRIAGNARRLKRCEGIDAMFVDYLQLVEPDNRRDPRQEQVADITRRLRALAGDLGIPIVALSQLNRDPETQKRPPRLSDLRESGAIEQDADTVFLLHQEGEEEEGSDIARITLHIAKQRNGPTGKVQLVFSKHLMSFEDDAQEYPFAKQFGKANGSKS